MSEELPNSQEPEQEIEQTPETPTPIDQLSDDELGALADNPELLAKYSPSEEEPTNAAEEPTEEGDEEPDPSPKEDAAPERVRLNALSETDARLVNAAVQMVRANPTLSIGEAMAALTPSKQPQEPAQSAETTPAPAHKSLVEEARAEVSATLAALKEAKDNYETDKDLELTEKLLDAKVKLFAAQEAEARQALEAETAIQAEIDKSIAQAVALYPDSGVEGTEFFADIQAEVERINQTNPEFFHDPSYPLALAGIVGARRGIAPAFASSSPSSQSKPATPPARSARAASIPVLGGNASRDLTNDRAAVFRQVEAIRSMEELEALADAVGSIKSTKLTA